MAGEGEIEREKIYKLPKSGIRGVGAAEAATGKDVEV